MKKYEAKKKEQGITLIALAVTIIVMIILAGVTIATLTGDSGIISKAKEARDKSAQENQDELAMLDELEKKLEKEMNGDGNGSDSGNDSENGNGDETNEDEFMKENTKVEYSDGEVWVPEGFKIADDSPSTVKEGVVIEDKAGNQFVWIPVADISDYKLVWYKDSRAMQQYEDVDESDDNNNTPTPDNPDNNGGNDNNNNNSNDNNNNSNDNNNNSNNSNSNNSNNSNNNNYNTNSNTNNSNKISTYQYQTTEDISSDTPAADYSEDLPDDEKTSVETYKGFYIGRYEAGKEENTVTIKKGQTPYISATQENARSLAEGFKDQYGYKAKTKLVSGYAWDTTIEFIQKNSSFSNYGKLVDKTRWNYGSSIIATGQTEPVCNIYDMSGNAWEWSTGSIRGDGASSGTMVYTYKDGNRIYRLTYMCAGAGARGGWSYTTYNLGFRITLFL